MCSNYQMYELSGSIDSYGNSKKRTKTSFEVVNFELLLSCAIEC